jgi:nicotinate-nucleotide adenylyltransferase
MSRAARVGIFGGTFNPIHLGHLRAAEEVLEALGLERMVFVPSGEPPHKTGSERDPIAPAELRLAWARAAIAGNPRFAVDALEVERGGTSYSVETLRTLGKQIAPDLPVFVLGVDAFAEVGTWREPEALFTLANFAVITRPGRAAEPASHWLPARVEGAFELSHDGRSARHRAAGTWARLLEIAALEISASEIRARLRSGRSVRYLLPETILEAVLQSRVYAA